MRAARLVSIVITLQQRGRTTAGYLAGELEVSERRRRPGRCSPGAPHDIAG